MAEDTVHAFSTEHSRWPRTPHRGPGNRAATNRGWRFDGRPATGQSRPLTGPFTSSSDFAGHALHIGDILPQSVTIFARIVSFAEGVLSGSRARRACAPAEHEPRLKVDM